MFKPHFVLVFAYLVVFLLTSCSSKSVFTSKTPIKNEPLGLAQCDEPPTVIRSVRVFDGENVHSKATVVIRCQKIVEFTKGKAEAFNVEGAIVIDGSGKTLLPGLIDGHVHTFKRQMLERTLDFGVTTVLDMGSSSPDFMKGIYQEDSAKQALDRADIKSAVLWITAPESHGTQFGPVPTLIMPRMRKHS